MGSLVPRVATPWATPAPKPMLPHHHEVVVNMDRILRAAGVEEEHVRRRLTAHSIIACGWRQEKCYNYNAWKCKLGSGWSGDWFVADTIEEKDGEEVPELGTKWRSYPSYESALADYRVWHMSRYAAAKAALLDEDRPDRDFCQGLKDGGYFTAQSGVDVLASICARVKKEMAAATPEELEAPLAEDDTRPFALLPVFAALVVAIGAVLCLIGVARTTKGK